jgi:hypothetical protein
MPEAPPPVPQASSTRMTTTRAGAGDGVSATQTGIGLSRLGTMRTADLGRGVGMGRTQTDANELVDAAIAGNANQVIVLRRC